MFTAVDFPAASLIGIPEIVIPIVDMNSHNNASWRDEEYNFLFKYYLWGTVSVSCEHEGEIVDAVPLTLDTPLTATPI